MANHGFKFNEDYTEVDVYNLAQQLLEDFSRCEILAPGDSGIQYFIKEAQGQLTRDREINHCSNNRDLPKELLNFWIIVHIGDREITDMSRIPLHLRYVIEDLAGKYSSVLKTQLILTSEFECYSQSSVSDEKFIFNFRCLLNNLNGALLDPKFFKEAVSYQTVTSWIMGNGLSMTVDYGKNFRSYFSDTVDKVINSMEVYLGHSDEQAMEFLNSFNLIDEHNGDFPFRDGEVPEAKVTLENYSLLWYRDTTVICRITKGNDIQTIGC